MELLVIDPNEFQITEEKAKEITAGLPQIIEERAALEQQYSEIIKEDITDDVSKRARELRLMISKNRTQGLNAWHKANKEFFLQGGRFVDAIKNKHIQINERMEAALMEIEKHQERKEQARREQLQKDREEKIKPLIKYPCPSNLWEMTEEMFDNFHRGAKAAYDEEIAAIQKAEEERQKREKEEADERERQRKENERLKAEAEAREKEIAAERAKAAEIAKKAEAKARKEREAIEKKAAEEKAKAEAKLKEEREARMKAEAAVAEIKRQEEERARIEAEKAEAELKSADSDKILLVVSELYFVRTKKRDFKSASSKKIYSEISAKIEEMENMLSDYEKKIRK